jgi:hypothetical protein
MRKRPLRRLLNRFGAWWPRRSYRIVTDPAKEYREEARQPILTTMKSHTIETSTINPDETLVQSRYDLNAFQAPLLVRESTPPQYASSTKVPQLEAHPRDPPEERIEVPSPRPVDKPPLPEFLPRQSIPKTLPFPSKYLPVALGRRRTKDSFQGSLESIDSLVESYWDPEEDSSLATPIATNRVESMDFLDEHVHFLRVQTQPRSVEVVWATNEGL